MFMLVTAPHLVIFIDRAQVFSDSINKGVHPVSFHEVKVFKMGLLVEESPVKIISVMIDDIPDK